MNVEIAQRLAELRRAKGYSQESLAHELGLSRQAISKWERAESSPDTDNLIALARLYDMSLDELLRTSPEVVEDAAFEADERAAGCAAANEAASTAAEASRAASSAADARDARKDEKGRWRSFPYWAVTIALWLILTIAGSAPFSFFVFLTIPIYYWLASILDGASKRRTSLERAEKAKIGVAVAFTAALIGAPVAFLATGGWLGTAMRLADGALSRWSGGAAAVATTLDAPIDKDASYLASKVRGLDVTWRGGSVRVTRGAADEVSVHASLPAGTYDMDPTGVSFELRDEGTLMIDDGLPEADNGLDYPGLQLEIQLPADDGWTLDQVSFDGVAGDVDASDLACQELSITGVSGDVDLLAAVEKDLSVETVSGNVRLAPKGGMPAKAHVETVSGDVTLDVGSDENMTLRFDTVSGRFSDAVGSDTADDDVLTYGNGAADVTVSTVSGALTVQ